MGEENSEKTTSGYLEDIRAYYMCNGCNHCPFYEAIHICKTIPLYCTWTPLIQYFSAEEKKEQENDT